MGRFPSPKYFFKTYTKNLTNPRFAEKRESIHKYLPKNFVTTDTSNIEKTPEILQTKWLEVFRDKPSNEPEH